MSCELNIKVVPNAKKAHIKEEKNQLKVYVCKPAIDGSANEAVIQLLAKYLGAKKRQIQIISGHKSREKKILIQEGKD